MSPRETDNELLNISNTRVCVQSTEHNSVRYMLIVVLSVTRRRTSTASTSSDSRKKKKEIENNIWNTEFAEGGIDIHCREQHVMKAIRVAAQK